MKFIKLVKVDMLDDEPLEFGVDEILIKLNKIEDGQDFAGKVIFFEPLFGDHNKCIMGIIKLEKEMIGKISYAAFLKMEAVEDLNEYYLSLNKRVDKDSKAV